MSIDYSQLAQPKSQPSADRVRYKHDRERQDLAFRRAIRDRDEQRCRCCGCRVIATSDLIQRRAEVHHAHGRVGTLRHELRNGILLCWACHFRVTHNQLFIVATRGSLYFTWTLKGGQQQRLLDMSGPVRFAEEPAA